MEGPLLSARRLALGHKDSSLGSILRLSKPFTESLTWLKDWESLVAMALVSEEPHLTTTSPELLAFRLDPRVASKIRKGAFNEIDLVEDLLIPV